MVTDYIANKLGTSFTRVEFKALVTKTVVQDHRLILAKPQTFMNESGQSVGILARYYKVPTNNIIVAYDDVDIPFCTLRLRPGGGSGGHRGIKSIIEKMGTEDFPRLRLGVGRPPGQMDAAAFVLQDFSAQETTLLPQIFTKAGDAVIEFILHGLEQAMNKFNGIGMQE